jgi:hypothetical protein
MLRFNDSRDGAIGWFPMTGRKFLRHQIVVPGGFNVLNPAAVFTASLHITGLAWVGCDIAANGLL